MNKCEHGQKITMFCASECCVWKEAGGCEACLRKYHNHMGPTIFVSEEEAQGIVRKYMIDQSAKPKCRLLQEQIYNYLTHLKQEITTSIDSLCKSIINQIGYPYLHSNGALASYKRLKNKEYRKVVQKDFKALYELNQKISEKDLVQEQARIYLTEIRQTHELLKGIEDMAIDYQRIVKPVQQSFSHDRGLINKINEIIKQLPKETGKLTVTGSDSPRRAEEKKREERKEEEKRDEGRSKRAVSDHPVKGGITINIYNEKKEKQASKQKQKSKDKQKSTQRDNNLFDLLKKNKETTPNRNNQMMMQSPPSLMKPAINYSRDVSIDRQVVKERSFNVNNTEKKSSKPKIEKKEEKPTEATQIKLLQQNSHKIENLKKELNDKEVEINEKKKMLIDMMKQKEDSLSQSQKGQKQPSLKDSASIRQAVTSTTKNENSFEKSFDKSFDKSFQRVKPKMLEIPGPSLLKKADSQNINDSKSESSKSRNDLDEQLGQGVMTLAFTMLPADDKAAPAKSRGELEQKVIVVPTPREIKQKQDMKDCDSPLLRKSSLMMEAGTSRDKGKNENSVELTDSEEKSLALLLKSLAYNASEAVTYLESSMTQSQNNLSAAEYLSYLYLELGRPMDCLKLCNKMLEKLQRRNKPQELSMILSNNKAASLNVLGRYSESIVVLEGCLRQRQKDYLFKNLGDAYFSISIFEKAIYNYQKALKLNDGYDEAHYNMAVCLYMQENYFNAKLAIKKALEMQPFNEAYQELLSNIETRINHYPAN